MSIEVLETALAILTYIESLDRTELLHRSEWIEESMDVQDLLTGVEAVYSDNESDVECEETASVSIFPISVSKTEKIKIERVKKQQDISKFSYPCEHCPNVYSNRGALWQHSVATHSVEKTCECKICGRKFYRNCSLALHLKSHSEEEYCQCKECGKSFNRLANLERHMRVHVDCEQFPCPHCDKVFRDKANLLRHIVLHSAQKMFQCEVCNKSYKSQDLLDVHYKNSHAQPEASLACTICGDVFKSYAELMQHDVVHSADCKLCKFCGKYFPDKTALKQHIMSHIKERLNCPICGIDFTQKSSLLRHVKRMHPQESDDIIDPSLFLDDKNSGLDSSAEESFDNGSLQEMENGTENESNSTVEIRKALGSPIKSVATNVVGQHKVLSGEISMIVENNLEKKQGCEITVENSSLNNNHLQKSSLQIELSLEKSHSEINLNNKTKETSVSAKLTNGDLSGNEKETVSKKKLDNESNGLDDTSTVAGESNKLTKSDISDPLTSVDINTMQIHSSALKIET